MSEKRKVSFTLLELVIVILVIGILASLALPGFNKSKEDALDKEAKVTLKLIQAAEKIYKMGAGTYYPYTDYIYGDSASNIDSINQNLKLSLPRGETRNWNYGFCTTGCSWADRKGADLRVWFLTIDDADGKPDPGDCVSCY